MSELLIIAAGTIFLCILAERFSCRFGMPALLLFILLGMLAGTDGILKIPFSDYKLAEELCTLALVFIMFFGGFCTNWKAAEPVAGRSLLLSTAGVIITAASTAAFCHFVLRFNMIESFLIGSVLSSTDAASVFSILRSRNLNLKYNTASILELESGSNDPAAYMLTAIGIILMQSSEVSSRELGITVGFLLLEQIAYGILVGIGIAVLVIFILTKTNLVKEELYEVFFIAAALSSFALCEQIGGNGFLSVYLCGIILGNSKISHKAEMVQFFNSITSLAQILLFFLLGLLAFPHKIPDVFFSGLLIAVFMIFIARPLAVFLILRPLHCKIRQCILVSWAGLRGAASVVFATMVIATTDGTSHDIFHIVFLVSLLSVAVQGSLLPFMAEKLSMVDKEADVRKTFTDYQEDSSMTLIRIYIPAGHRWEKKRIDQIVMPPDSLALMIQRGEETIVPKGDTVILAEDSVVLSMPVCEVESDISLQEIRLSDDHEWCEKSISELNLPDHILIAMVKRGEETIIPNGKTVLRAQDIVVAYK
jgi:cell volume regulation protein A